MTNLTQKRLTDLQLNDLTKMVLLAINAPLVTCEQVIRLVSLAEMLNTYAQHKVDELVTDYVAELELAMEDSIMSGHSEYPSNYDEICRPDRLD